MTATVLVDPRGKPTTYRFNGQGYLTQVTDALGQVTTYEREAGTNLLLSVTDSLNRVTRFQYDGNGNATQITDPANGPRTFTYEPTFSQVTSAVDPPWATRPPSSMMPRATSRRSRTPSRA